MEEQEQPLPPMGSLSEECNALKTKYDDCFNSWFSEKFLKGDKDLSVCDTYLSAYQECVKAALVKMNIDIKEVNRDVLGTHEEKLKPKDKSK